MLSGNTADATTLSGFLDRIEHRDGRANRIGVMDRGIPTEGSLAKMRGMGASFLFDGHPEGAADEAGAAVPRLAVVAGAQWCAGQALWREKTTAMSMC